MPFSDAGGRPGTIFIVEVYKQLSPGTVPNCTHKGKNVRRGSKPAPLFTGQREHARLIHNPAGPKLQNEGQLRRSCRHRTRRYSNNRIESDHRHIKRRLRSMHGPRTLAAAGAVIAGIEVVQMIRKGQVLGITRKNLHGQAWVFGSLLGLN